MESSGIQSGGEGGGYNRVVGDYGLRFQWASFACYLATGN